MQFSFVLLGMILPLCFLFVNLWPSYQLLVLCDKLTGMFVCSYWRSGGLRRAIHIAFSVIFFLCSVYSGLRAEAFLFFSSDLPIKPVLVSAEVDCPFMLEGLSYDSDVFIGQEEFSHLVDLREGSEVTCTDLVRVLANLFKKKKFEKIELQLEEGVEGKTVHFNLFGFWTFAQLRLHGIVIGKDKYRQYYMMEPGELFDQEKHQRSLEKIRKQFKKEGYFEAVVSDRLVREEKTKSVFVNLSFSRGVRFKIDDVSVFQKKDQKKFVAGDDISWIGARLISRLGRKSYSKKLINKEIEDLKKNMKRKGFLHVKIELLEQVNRKLGTVDLSFVLQFLHKKKFVFFGNSFFSDSQLLDVVLRLGQSVWLVPASILNQEIKQAYHKKGFWTSSVTVREERERDFFLIKEGERVSVKKIELKGVKNFRNTKVVKRCFRGVMRQKYFDHDILKNCLQKLVVFYQSRGFWDAHVLKHSFVPIEGHKNTYKLVVIFDEGEQSFFDSVSIPKFPKLLHSGPFVRFSKKGACIHFDPAILSKQRAFLKEHVCRLGYPNSDPKPEITRDGRKVKVCWNIDLGLPAPCFGKTILIGSSRFPFWCVERELCYREGDIWEKDKLKQSLERLRALGVFESVHLYPERCDLKKKAVFLKLREDDTFEVRFRAGFGLQQVGKNFPLGTGVTYRVGGTFLVKNPTNAGDRLVIDADFARSHKNVKVEYFRPYFFGLPAHSRYKLYANKYEQPGFVGSKKNLYEVVQQGFLIGFREVFRSFDIGFNVGVEWMETTIKRGMEKYAKSVARAIHFDSKLLGKKVPYFFFEPVLFVDRLDNKLNPTCGTLTLLTIKAMLPFCRGLPDANFIKFLAEQSFFYPLGRLFVGALRLRFGHVFYQNFEDIMPFERFYLGGAHSIRSYETDLCPPLGCFVDEDKVCYCVPQGGKSMVNLNLELRFPVFGAVGLVLFQDFGTLVGQSIKGFEVSDMLAATGFGLRYNTPIGPLRFDIGWKWRTRKTAQYSYAWFLTLGHAF